MVKGFLSRSRKWVMGAALCLAAALPLLTPGTAKAWWGPVWHPGWGWRGGVFVGLPPVVVGVPPVPVYPAYPYGYPYAPPYPYAYPYPSPWHWVPSHYTAAHVWVEGHWER
jgi:hypothetical protein